MKMSSIKTYLLFCLLILIFSCQDNKSGKEVEPLLHNPTPDTLTTITSDETKVEPLEDKYEMTPYENTIELAEKVFDIKTDVSLKTCKTFVDGCDCCTGKIVFIDKNIFIEEFYCLPSNNFYVGYYNIFGNRIILYYESNFVSYGPEDGMSYESEAVYTVHQFDSSSSVELTAYDCNGELIITSDESVYSESETITTAELLESYSMNEFWDLLKITEIIENFYQKK